MKCYKKEDLKRIGYYRSEEQLQERLKEIEYTFFPNIRVGSIMGEEQEVFVVGKENSDGTLTFDKTEFLTEIFFYEKHVVKDEVLDYLSKNGLKVEELFHVTKKNIKVIATFDGFCNGIAEDIVLPDWLKKRVQDCSVVVERKNFGQPITKVSEEIYLVFTNCTNRRDTKVNFGNYIALLDDESLKVFSEELVDKFHLEK